MDDLKLDKYQLTKENEELKKRIIINSEENRLARISGCSIGSIVGLLYLTDNLDMMTNLYNYITKSVNNDTSFKEDLSKFRQIVIEFHHFIQSNNSDVLDKYLNVLKKINKTHQSINVHGNNCGPWSFKKMDLPNVLEITYLRKTDYEFKNFDKELTEKYNMPNCPKKPEMIFLKSEYLIK